MFFYQLLVPCLAYVALYKCLLGEETKRHLRNVGPYLHQEISFLFAVRKPDPSLSREFQENSQGSWRHAFPRVQEKRLPLSYAVLGPALSTPATPALRCLATPRACWNQKEPLSPQGTDRWPERSQVTSTSRKESAKVLLLIHWPSTHSPPETHQEGRSGGGQQRGLGTSLYQNFIL